MQSTNTQTHTLGECRYSRLSSTLLGSSCNLLSAASAAVVDVTLVVVVVVVVPVMGDAVSTGAGIGAATAVADDDDELDDESLAYPSSRAAAIAGCCALSLPSDRITTVSSAPLGTLRTSIHCSVQYAIHKLYVLRH
jgi:hypothetical protein